MDDYRREIADAPPGWTIETAERRAKKYGRRTATDRSAGPTYWFISDSGELPPPFNLRMGKQWSPTSFLIPFLFTLLGPVVIALWLRRRAERSRATQAAAVWVHWILNATWLYWIFSASANAVADLLAHLRIDNLAATFLCGSVLMALPPLFAVGACTAILLRDPEGAADGRKIGELVKRAVARESVLMVPFAIFLGSSGSFEADWRLSAVALLVAFIIYRLLAWYVSRWMTRGAEILTHGELMETAAAIASRAGVALKSVYVFGNTDEREVNAFAGRGGMIAVTRGLVQRLTRRELTAVIGHETGHLRGKHIAMSTVAFWAYVLLSGPATAALVKYAHLPVFIFSLPLMPLAYIFAVSFLSRKNEFDADKRAVDLSGDAEAMIAALARLRMLTRTPVAWGGIQGSLLSHPSMRDRVLAIARHARIDEERALALLQDPDLLEAGTQPELLHFTLPAECAGKELVYSSNAKMTYLLWIGWLEHVFLVAFFLGLLAAAARLLPWSGFSVLAVVGAMPLTAASYLVFSNWVGRMFIRSVRDKLRQQMGARAEGGTFAGLLPGPLTAPVEGFYQWDAGFFWLTPDALVFRGERTSFALARGSIRAISIVKGPLSWDRAHLVRLECGFGALQLSRPDVGTMSHQAKRFKRSLEDWLQGSGETVYTNSEAPAPEIVMRPASTEWMRGWAAVRYHGKRALLLCAGISMLEPFAKTLHLPGVSALPIIVPLAYIAINLPNLLRPAPELSRIRQPEPEVALVAAE